MHEMFATICNHESESHVDSKRFDISWYLDFKYPGKPRKLHFHPPPLTFNVRWPSFSGLTEYISWLLMPWPVMSPWHQHPLYWLWRIGRASFYIRNDFKYLCHVNVENIRCKYTFMILCKCSMLGLMSAIIWYECISWKNIDWTIFVCCPSIWLLHVLLSWEGHNEEMPWQYCRPALPIKQ